MIWTNDENLFESYLFVCQLRFCLSYASFLKARKLLTDFVKIHIEPKLRTSFDNYVAKAQYFDNTIAHYS